MVLTNFHPGLDKKVVYILDCKVCEENVCRRGMLAVLVADGKTVLFSTDKYDKSSVGVIPEVYMAKNCRCKIQSLACLCCGSVVGYHVIVPCIKCLSSVNNGHHCMFHSNLVSYCYRLDEEGGDFLLWKQLKSAKEDDLPATECIR
uniref:Protein FAM72A n=2 Tax=Arion vulgaris TaxID=1028688 RepID=A0A0B6ZIN4_9EUPU